MEKLHVQEKVRKRDQKGSQNDAQNGAKMEPWALQGATFTILGRLGRGRFLMRFWSGKKSAQNRKYHAKSAYRGGRGIVLGRPGGMSGGTGEGTLGEGAENFA